MEKDSLICFRVSRNLQESLVKIAPEERRSLSSLIELVLYNYLKMRKTFMVTNKERRTHPRKAILAPALIKQYCPGETKLDTAAIMDISLGGMRIAMPKDTKCEITGDPQASKFEIVFALPHENRPIYIMCEPCRVVDSKEIIHVGASFANAALDSYKELQTYLK